MTAILEPPTVTTAEQPRPAPAPPAPPVPPRAPVPEARAPRRTRPVLPATGVRLVGVALLALLTIGTAVQPAPNGPEPVAPGWVVAIETGITVALLASLVGFALGRRWALTAGLVTGSGLLVLSVLCPSTGHHAVAGWWFAQLATSAAMVLLPAAALAGTRAART